MDLSDLNKHIEQIINEHNKRVVTGFEGYSPDEIRIPSYKVGCNFDKLIGVRPPSKS